MIVRSTAAVGLAASYPITRLAIRSWSRGTPLQHIPYARPTVKEFAAESKGISRKGRSTSSTPSQAFDDAHMLDVSYRKQQVQTAFASNGHTTSTMSIAERERRDGCYIAGYTTVWRGIYNPARRKVVALRFLSTAAVQAQRSGRAVKEDETLIGASKLAEGDQSLGQSRRETGPDNLFPAATSSSSSYSPNAIPSAISSTKQTIPPSSSQTRAPVQHPQSPNDNPASSGDSPTSPIFSHFPDITGPRFTRPTKEELLAAATGFWSRLRVRFKWFSIRSVRPFNSDDLSAFFSWILVGHVIWILVGTTTFFSLLILALNTVFAQDTLGRWVGSYLTQSSGVKVVFESAIVPKWRDGVITFKNVFVSRRPGAKANDGVSKGSQTTAAAQAAAAALLERSSPPSPSVQEEQEDTNYTQYDLSIETVNVTLSFAKWLNGKGLLRSVDVRGIRGVVDRSHIFYPPEAEHIDPRSYRHTHVPGDFELDHFRMEDVLVSVHQPDAFRPYSVSIFSADLPCLRKRWLFYDLLAANHISGSFDGSLFTVHPRQTHNLTGAQLAGGVNDAAGVPAPPGAWKKHSRLRIDGVRIDHLNRGVEGPLGWIHEGAVDVVADIMFPTDEDEGLARVVSDFYDRLEASVSAGGGGAPLSFSVASQPQPQSQSELTPAPIDEPLDRDRFLILDLSIALHGVRASVPLTLPASPSTPSLTHATLIRPIVAYMNSHRGAYIPVRSRVAKRARDFDGAWTVYDSGLMQDLARATHEAFVRDVGDEGARRRRISKVGWWGVGIVVRALVLGFAGGLA